MSRIVAFVPDLMDRSRFGALAVDTTFVREAADVLTVEAEVIVVDLNRPGVPDLLPQLAGRKVIAFSSHVERDTMKAAAMSSDVEVLARSVFFTRLKTLLEA